MGVGSCARIRRIVPGTAPVVVEKATGGHCNALVGYIESRALWLEDMSKSFEECGFCFWWQSGCANMEQSSLRVVIRPSNGSENWMRLTARCAQSTTSEI